MQQFAAADHVTPFRSGGDPDVGTRPEFHPGACGRGECVTERDGQVSPETYLPACVFNHVHIY